MHSREKKTQKEVSDEDFLLLVKVLIRGIKFTICLLERLIDPAGRHDLRREMEGERKEQGENLQNTG